MSAASEFCRHRINEIEVTLPRPRSPLISRTRVCHRLLVSLHVLVVPTQVSFIAILHVARPRDAVELVWIDHELSFDAETPQRLVHLLTTLDGHVEVALAAKEQRRRLDAISMQK